MHMVIRAIVYGKTKREAFNKAKQIFNRLTENQRPFDYYTTFDDETAQMSGKARWGKLPVCVKVSSKEGKKLVKDGMKWTKEHFEENMDKIRKCIKIYSNEELREEKDTEFHGMFRYRCHCVGQDRGSQIWLYDNDGEGITNEKHLKDVLNKWKCLYEDSGKENPQKNEDIWIVPADVHY